MFATCQSNEAHVWPGCEGVPQEGWTAFFPGGHVNSILLISGCL